MLASVVAFLDANRLQWGRGCVATEIGKASSRSPSYAHPSMGPWLCSHGNKDVDYEALASSPDLQWGRGCVATEITGRWLSMAATTTFNGAVAV